ncbi:MAG: hypothetical protein M1820_009366 [Bogoriella megaspora]|nr:MAG: hypothetical protein M1820_009366 [Bogoriella megaspora]
MNSRAGLTEHDEESDRMTEVLPASSHKILKKFIQSNGSDKFPNDWQLELNEETADSHNLQRAAHSLRHSSIPVAFPTETVYGLGADATRSEAVRGIYKAKRRPADNPLIVHVCSLNQLRQLLLPSIEGDVLSPDQKDPIPVIYRPLIEKFWPGPLTIILPNPKGSKLAEEVTAGLQTFGARMPQNLLALSLIRLAEAPLAAPSANASTKPSPTAAEHVKDDLNGRIDIILDGGPCDVGVESTVVDGLSDPPTILRPGGISIDFLRSCPGWESVTKSYKDEAEKASSTPRAPGMKYRHYSPKAKVILFGAGMPRPTLEQLAKNFGSGTNVGLIHTKRWLALAQNNVRRLSTGVASNIRPTFLDGNSFDENDMLSRLLRAERSISPSSTNCSSIKFPDWADALIIWEISLGDDTENIARGLFSALRELDRKGVDVILVEGIDENEGNRAAAIMNRLRKAAEVELHA